MNKNKYRVITFTALSQTGKRHMFKSSRPHALVTELMCGCRSALQRLLQPHEVFGGWGGPPSTSANTPLASHIYLRRSPIALPPSLGKGGGGGDECDVCCITAPAQPVTIATQETESGKNIERQRRSEAETVCVCVCVCVNEEESLRWASDQRVYLRVLFPLIKIISHISHIGCSEAVALISQSGNLRFLKKSLTLLCFSCVASQQSNSTVSGQYTFSV